MRGPAGVDRRLSPRRQLGGLRPHRRSAPAPTAHRPYATIPSRPSASLIGEHGKREGQADVPHPGVDDLQERTPAPDRRGCRCADRTCAGTARGTGPEGFRGPAGSRTSPSRPAPAPGCPRAGCHPVRPPPRTRGRAGCRACRSRSSSARTSPPRRPGDGASVGTVSDAPVRQSRWLSGRDRDAGRGPTGRRGCAGADDGGARAARRTAPRRPGPWPPRPGPPGERVHRRGGGSAVRWLLRPRVRAAGAPPSGRRPGEPPQSSVRPPGRSSGRRAARSRTRCIRDSVGNSTGAYSLRTRPGKSYTDWALIAPVFRDVQGPGGDEILSRPGRVRPRRGTRRPARPPSGRPDGR